MSVSSSRAFSIEPVASIKLTPASITEYGPLLFEAVADVESAFAVFTVATFFSGFRPRFFGVFTGAIEASIAAVALVLLPGFGPRFLGPVDARLVDVARIFCLALFTSEIFTPCGDNAAITSLAVAFEWDSRYSNASRDLLTLGVVFMLFSLSLWLWLKNSQ